MNFFPGSVSLPPDSETANKFVINLRLEMLGPVVQQLSSAREITVRSTGGDGTKRELEFGNQPE